MRNVTCHSGHAVVPVTGMIGEDMMLPLVAAIKQLHQEYFYAHIELDVCSPGGQVHALDYCVETMDTLRARGVRFTTRALMSVSSAAANLVSLGDWRIASRGATFLYHQARAGGMDSVTVQSARQILSAVDKIDERYLTRLVVQARRGKRPGTALHPRDFADGDWPVMEHLLNGAGAVQTQTQAGRARVPRKALLQRLRKHVGAGLRAEDEGPLKRLYRCLFELDRHISAGLALALGLIDAISDENALESGEVMADQACIPEWAPLFSPEGRVSRPTLCRHTLALGETGSGKTVSGILPIIGSIMAPENHMVGCTLVIDPKHEIRDVIGQLQHPDIAVHDIDVEQAERRPVLNLMAGHGQSLAPSLAEDQFMEAARQILIRSASLSPMSAARAMTDCRVDDRDIYWAGEGARLAQTALGLTLLIIQHRQRIYGDSESPGLIDNADPEARSLLAAFGVEAGFLAESEDIKALVNRTKRELRKIGHLWREAEQQKAREEEMAEKAASRRRWAVDRGRAEVETHAQGEFVLQQPILIPVTVAELEKAEAAQDKDDEAPVEQVCAVTLYTRWQKALAPIMQGFAEAVHACALYSDSRRFRDAFELGIDKAASYTDHERIRDEVLAGIGQAALYPLDDRSIRPAPNILALAQTLLQSFFKATRRDSGGNKKKTAGLSSTKDIPAMTVVGLLKDDIQSGQADTIYDVIEQSWNPMARAETQSQYVGVFGYARTCFVDFSDKTPAWTLFFGCEPYYRSVMAHGRADFLPIDFSRDVDETDTARRCVYVFQPRLDMNEAIVAKALKAAFFEAVLANRRRQQNGQSMPLVGYVADEFHRFITSDRNHGEQSYLDTCRSFGAFCVLACQSIASMEHALAGVENNEILNRAAVSILLNNTGNKLFFRSTDRALCERVDQLCPGGGALGKVTYVRPLSTLKAGECYASLSDGRFERRQLLPFKTVKVAASRTAVQ